MLYDLIVIGGGAAGMFAALLAKERHPERRILVLEKTAVLLSKVRISGGGRCNVTHHCFDPKELVKNYPRGERALLGPFSRFQPSDMIEWLSKRGVRIKREDDGRCFPQTDTSATIIHCFLEEAKKLGVEIQLRSNIQSITKEENFHIVAKEASWKSKSLLVATGSSVDGHKWAEQLGHCVIPLAPSLFTFNVPQSDLRECSGIALEASIEISDTSLVQRGALLITHFGFSGPAVLKLSAFGARILQERGYKTEVYINWLPDLSEENVFQRLLQCKEMGSKMLSTINPFGFPKNFWRLLVGEEKRMADYSHKALRVLASKLHKNSYTIDGKTTHKEEFVSCGGVCLQEVDTKTMQSKKCPGLFFAGEILDVDGVTGGFNFQHAWTSAFLVAHHY